jgi:hypothetical protein
MSNRRLVATPTRKPRPAKTQAAQAAMIAPSGLKSWHAFAFLIVIAIIWYYFRPLLIVGGLLAGLLLGLGWLSHRFPRTMLVLLTFVNALLRGGRRR